MNKLFNDHAKERFAQALANVLPHYKAKKSLKCGVLPGALCCHWRVDTLRSGWIAFGGIKESHFAVVAGWTVSGMELRALPEWEQYRPPRAFEVPPVPSDGLVDLRERWRFESSDEGPWYPLDLDGPPLPLATRIFEAYTATPAFEEQCKGSYRGALRIYTRNPPTEEDCNAQTRKVEFTYCKTLWSHLVTRHAFSTAELDELLVPIVEEAVRLVLRHGHPLIQQQLGIDVETT